MIQCQEVWNKIRYAILTGLIWVQTVCYGHEQINKSQILDDYYTLESQKDWVAQLRDKTVFKAIYMYSNFSLFFI